MWKEGVRIYDTPGVPNNFPRERHLNFYFYLCEMLWDTLKTIINNPFKESFYGKRKRKEKQLMFWQFLSFSIKVMSKLS